MTLSEQQRRFPPLVAKLIIYIYEQLGLEVTFSEAWRTPEQAAWNAAHGHGIVHSLHCDRLAIDLNLFKDGVYLTDKADYQPAGDYWKMLDADARWGGDFHSPDSDHFSLTFGGIQ